ncbi:hypothetical protein AHMF7605_18060 [Adhaeribacter arboris]|uniref:Uncharacterized protein n=1 Tax=Adhaeribacter arboris TaxID=2072846 RepID=A0A2T2YIE0_9BACT|nr:hypothetical protein AHMF7605_18060 [Adhaeribacter arboris]
MKGESNYNSGLTKRIILYLVGLILTSIGHLFSKGNSHTAPLSFPIIVLFIIPGTIWLIADYLHYKPQNLISIHVIGLLTNFLIIILIT